MSKKLLVAIFVVLLFILVNIYKPSVETQYSILGTRGPIILAHRGSRVLNPENTIMAFRNAIDFGADVVETDVQLTKDGQLVIFHDDMLDRVTNGSGRVAEFTLVELRKLDVAYKFTHDNGTSFPFRGKGITIPTPAEVFDTFPDAYFNIEIKNKDIQAAIQLHNVIVAKGMTNKVTVGGRWCSSVKHFRQLNTDVHIQTSACEGEVIAFLFHSFIRTASLWYTFFHFPAHSLQVPTESGPFHLDTSVVFDSLKLLGKHVHFWVINDPIQIKRLVLLGADGIITDRPDLAVQVFEELGLKEKRKREIYEYRNSRYYVPEDTHVEKHTCVGLICVVLQNIDKYAQYISTQSAGLTVIIVLALAVYWQKKTKKKLD